MQPYLNLRNKNYMSTIVPLSTITDAIKSLQEEGNGKKDYYFSISVGGVSKVFVIKAQYFESGQIALELFRDYENYGSQDMYVQENFLVCSFSSRGLDHVLTDAANNNIVEVDAEVAPAMAAYVQIFLDSLQVISKMPY